MWLLSPKYSVGVTGLLLDDEGRVLLLRHTYRGSKPWGLPGGGLQPGETLEECLERELREETGMHVEVGELLWAASHTHRRLVDFIYRCTPLPGQSIKEFRPGAEVVEARYFAADSLPNGVSRRLQGLVVRLGKPEEQGRSLHHPPHFRI